MQEIKNLYMATFKGTQFKYGCSEIESIFNYKLNKTNLKATLPFFKITITKYREEYNVKDILRVIILLMSKYGNSIQWENLSDILFRSKFVDWTKMKDSVDHTESLIESMLLTYTNSTLNSNRYPIYEMLRTTIKASATQKNYLILFFIVQTIVDNLGKKDMLYKHLTIYDILFGDFLESLQEPELKPLIEYVLNDTEGCIETNALTTIIWCKRNKRFIPQILLELFDYPDIHIPHDKPLSGNTLSRTFNYHYVDYRLLCAYAYDTINPLTYDNFFDNPQIRLILEKYKFLRNENSNLHNENISAGKVNLMQLTIHNVTSTTLLQNLNKLIYLKSVGVDISKQISDIIDKEC